MVPSCTLDGPPLSLSVAALSPGSPLPPGPVREQGAESSHGFIQRGAPWNFPLPTKVPPPPAPSLSGSTGRSQGRVSYRGGCPGISPSQLKYPPSSKPVREHWAESSQGFIQRGVPWNFPLPTKVPPQPQACQRTMGGVGTAAHSDRAQKTFHEMKRVCM